MKFKLLIAAMLVLGNLPMLGEEVVNVYSYRHYQADSDLYEEFTKKTGIKVNVVKSKADTIIERLKSEGSNSKADLLITSDASRLIRAKKLGLFQSGVSETILAQVPKNLRDPENTWFGITVRARVIAYSKERVAEGEILDYFDLTKPEWKGRVVARSSSNIYNQSLLASMIANEGLKKAASWAIGVRKNMARTPQGSDRDQLRAVAAGLADVAIVNTYYIGLLANSEDKKDNEIAEKVKICFPNQDGVGTHINISGAGICKYAPNKENALRLIEFLTSTKSQHVFSSANFEFPLSLNSKVPLLHSWGEFKADTLNLQELGEYNAKAAEVYTAAQWE